MLTKPIEDHSGEEILDAVESIHRELIEGNSTIFRCALEFANIHNGDAVSTLGRVIPGTERSIRLGGPGTPRVMEFAAAELGARMQVGTFSANQAPVDAHEIPDRHREAVHLRTPADMFPYSSNTSRATDIDHTLAYLPLDQGRPPGQSNMGNYGPAVRFHHRIKTHGNWELRQPFPGIYIWRDPHGHYFVVDHTGTRKITVPSHAA